MKTLLSLLAVVALIVSVPQASVASFDFGDAPESYSTTLAGNGPSHGFMPGFQLGVALDSEPDGQPSVGAVGDGDDEDGIVFQQPLIPGEYSLIEVSVVGAGGSLDAWIDFNLDGDFYDPSEQIVTSYPVPVGQSLIVVNVPVSATPGFTYARFRLSMFGGLSPTGPANGGEVEDYQVRIVPEPTTMAFLGLGGLCFIRRKHKAS